MHALDAIRTISPTMASATDPSRIADGDRPLRDRVESIQDVLDMSTERLKSAPLVTVIGVLLDYQPPIQTRGKGTCH